MSEKSERLDSVLRRLIALQTADQTTDLYFKYLNEFLVVDAPFLLSEIERLKKEIQ